MMKWLTSAFGARDPNNIELEAAVMPVSGRVVVMSASGNEVIDPAKAHAITEAVLTHRAMVAAAESARSPAQPA
jgi:hypothetical protein